MSPADVARQIDLAITNALWSLGRESCPDCGYPLGDDRFARQILTTTIYNSVNEALETAQMIVPDPTEGLSAFQLDMQREARLAQLNSQRKKQ